MKCLFHKWETLHRRVLDSGCWFEDRKCKKCGKREMIDHTPVFSTIGDAIELGVLEGVYNAIEKDGVFEKLINEELSKQLTSTKDTSHE